MSKEVQGSRFKVQSEDTQSLTPIVLRLATFELKKRIAELLPDTPEDAMVIYVAERESQKWHFIANETAIYNSIIIVEPGGRLEVNYDVSVRSMNYRQIVLSEGSELLINDLVVCVDSVDMTTRLTAHRDSKVKNVAVMLGGDESSFDYKTEIAGEGALTEQWGLMMLGGNEQAKFKVAVNHKVAGCTSNELIKGIAASSAQGEFNGLVYVAPDAQRTEALQESRNLLLGDDCRFITSPQLEIYADDVKCSHGATVGQMEDNALFYMRQRGLSESDARRLQLTGFVGEIVQKIDDEEFRERVNKAVEEKLNRI